MSRVARMPIPIPKGVEVSINGQIINLKGPQGSGKLNIHDVVNVVQDNDALHIKATNDNTSANAMAGTSRALINNLVMGVSKGHERKLTLVGVGYRAQIQGDKLTLALGYSHPIIYIVPEGIKIEAPSQTEIVIKGINKDSVGEVAAKIRSFRPPEPYKGKGIRYSDEQIIRKEAKKK